MVTVNLAGCPLNWKTGKSGKSQGKMVLMNKSGKFMKNCQSQGKVHLRRQGFSFTQQSLGR